MGDASNLETVQCFVGMCVLTSQYKMTASMAPSLKSSLHFLTTHRTLATSCKQLFACCTLRIDQLPVAMASRAPILLLLVVVAIAHLAFGTNALSCNTNGASPTQSAANDCVQFIRGLGGATCCQQNCGGDFCTQMRAQGGARVLICGACNKCTTCTVAGNALNNVLAQCVRNVDGTARVAGNDNAAGFAFVIDVVHNSVKADNATDEVIQMVREE